MIDWKILAVIFVSFVLLAGSVATDLGVKDIFVSVTEGITGFVGFEGSPLARNVEFKAEIVLDDYSLHADTTNVSLSGDPFQIAVETKPKQTIKTGGLATLYGFKGDVVFASGTVALEGVVEKVENIDYEKPTKMKSTGFVYESVKFDHLSIGELKEDSTGLITTETLNYSLNGTIEIHGFLGQAEFAPGILRLDGKANRILATGQEKLSLVS